ncbi:MAG: FAD-dependent oxidoreductase [Pseudomonadota bacterium]|uniref:FAD-dependent oxidoreductase n=1 Tax=Candidatus Desulfatibia profunda TaxID=2841695 RepID=A0A8J6NU22_9BACT|nr:FAD-dependent oxidoreductase [Candidatus Desulfatibia profunda]MBU0698709.1 FAD-dependent oxidoreductase [Pseudomonadota bacterium]
MENKSVLVVGGGPEGIRAALEKADQGVQVTLLEKFPTLGGERIPRDRLIKPAEAFANRDLDKVRSCPNIRILTYSDLKKVTRENGRVRTRILKRSLRVDNSKCNDCKACIKVCPVNMFDDFNQGLGFRTAVDYCNPNTGEYNVYKEDMPICQQTCPVNLDIRSYVGLIADGRHLDSLATIRERLPLPGSIGRICPHPCETACNRQYLDEPISICFLKRYVADVELHQGIEPVYATPEKKFPEKIAIIGAGPAGLTCAHDLAKLGYQHIKIFEALPVPGGYLWVGIPEYRLPKKLLQREVDLICNMGVEIQYNTRIGKDIAFEDLKNDYDAVFIGIGCHIGLKLHIPGEDEYEGIIDCVTFLRNQALGGLPEAKGKLIVIGGGNAAIDSARVGWRMGFDEVYILYRRTKKEMPANPWEIDAAEHEGVILQYLAAPVEILGENGKVTGMKCIKMELGAPDASGRRRPVPMEGSEYVIDAQTIVPAISQGTDLSFLPQEHNLKLSRWQTFEIDEETGMTNVPGVFAGGDVVTGPDIAIRAVAGGKRAAAGIHAYLRSK